MSFKSVSVASAVSTKAASFCPIPHLFRDQVWLIVGGLIGVTVGSFVGANYFARASQASGGNARPRVLSGPARVVNIPGITIDEHVGNASNGDAGISIAAVVISKACTEATQRPQFDEYVLVRSGVMVVAVAAQNCIAAYQIKATAGQMLHLPRGFLYTYSFPGACEYIPVCLPAFTPTNCGRVE